MSWKRTSGNLGLALLYGVGRFIDVYSGSFYSGERSPYLMMPAPTEMTIRLQSEEAYTGVARYGLNPEQLDNELSTHTRAEEHELRLQNLQPGTRYYYSLGSQQHRIYQGHDYWFVTPPDQKVPVRIMVIGDPGQPGEIQDNVRAAFMEYLHENPRTNTQLDLHPGQAYMDIFLTTGDNAYKSGSNKQFQAGFFSPYADILRNVPVWPVYGNHDARRWAFYDIFSLPEQAQSGGVASGTESYYSFDYSNVHIVILDSQDSDMDHNGKMLHWLKQDLKYYQENTKLQWLIVAFHHPPYSKGSHNSDDIGDSGGRLVEARENLLPVIEQAGADLVLTGHSHMYERSHLMACHYGDSASLTEAMVLDTAEENQSSDMAFVKPMDKVANQGTIYAVVGSSSKLNQGPLDHPAMKTALEEAGSLLLDIDDQKLSGKFINQDGLILDEFSILKTKEAKPIQRHCQH